MLITGIDLYSLGYIGILLLSLVASLVVFVPLPYFSVIVLAALSGKFDPVLLVVSSSVGAAVGKMVVFQASYSAQKLASPKTRTNLKYFERLFSRCAWLAIFFAASTPVPDDIVYIPLGLARYNRLKFFISTVVGKMVLTSIVVFGAGLLSDQLLEILVGQGNLNDALILITVLFVIITLLVTYFIIKIDWNGLNKNMQKKKNSKISTSN